MKAMLVGLVLTSMAAQPPASPRQVGIAAALQGSYAGQKSLVLGEAAKMPDADYGFKPSSMAEVRTFAQVVAHIADAQFDTCANVKGVPNPASGKDIGHTLATRADVAKALADSFALCDDVFASTTDENALQPTPVRLGPRTFEMPRASVLYGLLAHTAEMYGIGTVYLRAKGLVPPASEPQGRGRGGQ
jgi:DinB family protein